AAGFARPGFDRHMPETLVFVDAFAKQKIDVIQEKPTTFAQGHRSRRTARGDVSRLRQNPRVAKYAATDEHPADAAPEAFDHLGRFEAVAAAKHGDREVPCDL